ncbi:MAG: sugar phosphate isomerase/epimerase [Pirellulaceae bacterium]|nr:sugar phosphate isomerase/epimerase [Pirellulaceae bacterium]
MQLGFATAILPELSLTEVMEFAGETGYQCIEVMCWPVSQAERRYAGVTHIDVTKLDAAEIERIGSLVQRTGVSISALGYYPNCLSPNPDEAAASVAHLQRVIAAAPHLGLKKVNTFIGRDYTRSVDDNWPRLLETWRPIVAQAQQVGVQIGIENCPMLFSKDEWPGGKNIAISPAIWRRLFDDLASDHLGLNYDPSHMVWQHMDYLAPLRDFADRLFHIHLKDVRIDTEKLNQVGILAHPAQYHTPKLPGLGDINWGKFFSILLDVGYRGPACVEVEDRAYEKSIDTRKDSLRQSYRYLKSFIP